MASHDPEKGRRAGGMNPEVFPGPCPPSSSWTITDPEFLPGRIWEDRKARMVKEAKRRRIIHASGYYIKAFRLAPGPPGRLRDPARKEFSISRRLWEKKITPMPAGYASLGRWSYFAAKEAPGLELEVYLEKRLRLLKRRQIRRFESLFAGFLMELASCGVFQPDFHLNNCLFHEKSERFFLLDLHRARMKDRPLSGQEIIEQLVYVLPPFMDRVSERNILETVSHLSSRGLKDLKDRAKRYMVLEKGLSNMRAHYAGKEGRKTRAMQVGSRRGPLRLIRDVSADASLEDALAELVLRPENFLEDPDVTKEILKDSRHTLCIRARLLGKDFFIKAYRSSSTLKSLSYLLRTPRSIRTWELSRRLSFRGISVISPLVLVQARNPWRPVYGAVLFPWIESAAASRARMIKALSEPVSADTFFKHLSFFIWQMHEKGMVHGDCKATNFVYLPQSGKKTHKFLVFDLDSTRIEKEVKDKERISDISCMCRSLEKLTNTAEFTGLFLKHYIRFHVPWTGKHASILGTVKNLISKKGN